MLVIWAVFFIVVVVRILRPSWLKNISYWWLIGCAVAIHLLYGAAATLLTYFVWSTPMKDGSVNQMGHLFLTAPYPKEAPLPLDILEWTRPLLSGTHGYFVGSSFFHYFLSTIALLIVTGVFVGFFKMYKREHPAKFKEGDIEVIALAFLIAGWAGSIVLAPLSLIFAVILVIIKMVVKKEKSRVSISQAFIIAAPFAFVFAIPLLTLVNLWPRLKL